MRRFLPVLTVLLAWHHLVQAQGLLIPAEKSRAAAGDAQPQGDHHHRGPGGRHHASSRPSATTPTGRSKRPTSSPSPRAPASTSSPCGSTARKSTASWSRPPRPAQIYTEHRPPHPGPRPARIHRQQPAAACASSRSRPSGDQKVTLSYTARRAAATAAWSSTSTRSRPTARRPRRWKKFSIKATIKSQHAVQNVYSPTHAITLNRTNDKRSRRSASTSNQGLLDKDFQLFYSLGDKDVGLTALTHRPIAAEDGYFMLLISPQVELSKEYQVPRDMVLVLDTSGSMRGVKMEQARKALKYCLDNLGPKDRFALINFATTVNKYRDEPARRQHGAASTHAKKWVDDLRGDRRHRHQRRPARRPGDAHRGRGPHRSPSSSSPTASRPSARPNPDKILKNVAGEEHGQHAHLHLRRRRRRQRHVARPAGRADAGRQHLRPAGRRTSRPRSAACTARSAIRC